MNVTFSKIYINYSSEVDDIIQLNIFLSYVLVKVE